LPTPSPTATGTVSTTDAPAATPTPAAVDADAETETDATAETTAPADPYPADQGCYLFQNELPVSLTLELIGAESGATATIDLPAGEEGLSCFDPDQYTYTIRYRISGSS